MSCLHRSIPRLWHLRSTWKVKPESSDAHGSHRASQTRAAFVLRRVGQLVARRTTWTASIAEIRSSEPTPGTCNFDSHLLRIARDLHEKNLLRSDTSATLAPGSRDWPSSSLYTRYRAEADTIICPEKIGVLPYEAYPSSSRRADRSADQRDDTIEPEEGVGDGIVLVVHVYADTLPSGGMIQTDGRTSEPPVMSTSSGFVIRTERSGSVLGGDAKGGEDVVVTCAHALEEIHRRAPTPSSTLISYILPSTLNSSPRRITSILSSSLQSDLLVMTTERPDTTCSNTEGGTGEHLRLRSLPVSPYPIGIGADVLCHTFGAGSVPNIKRARGKVDESVMRPTDLHAGREVKPTQAGVTEAAERNAIERPIAWPHESSYRRWARGTFLGYRSHSMREVHPGTADRLPHILTSILPTPGSSGGPIVDLESGAVVGVVSGRRMENRVEGERGWGASAEGIFEMFALPGFTPASRKNSA